MDPSHLLEDEYEIECQVRGLEGDTVSLDKQLKAQLELEKQIASLIPKKPHLSAYKAPRREIQICRAKLLSCQENVKKFLEVANVDECVKYKSRLLHIECRLLRMSHSKVVAKDVEKLSLELKQLLSLLDGVIVSNERVEATNLANLTFEISEEEDFDDLIAQSTKLPRGFEQLQNIPGPSSRVVNFQDIGGINVSHSTQNIQGTSEELNPVNSDDQALRDLLSKQKLDHLVEMLNEVILTKSTLLTTQELQNIEYLSLMDTPPSRTPKKSFIPTYPIPNLNQVQESVQVNSNACHPSVVSALSSNPSQTSNDSNKNQNNLNQTFIQNQPANEYPNHTSKSQKFTFLKRDPSSWGLSFHGSVKDPPIEQFLFRVESIAVGVFRLNLDQLVNEFCVFLKDDAQNWYWNYRHRNSRNVLRYAQFRQDLITRFRDRHSDYDIKYMLSSRRQHFKESEDFRKYYDEIHKISSRLQDPLPDSELLEIMRRNMRPGLQLALANKQILNLDELFTQCVKLETLWSRLGYNPESSIVQKKSICEATADFMPVQETSFDHSYVDAINMQRAHNFPSRANSVPKNVSDPNSLIICFNCDDIGHHFKDCPSNVRKVFCHGCGDKGIYLPQCIKCRPGNLNSNARMRSPGMSHPPVPTTDLSQQKNSQ